MVLAMVLGVLIFVVEMIALLCRWSRTKKPKKFEQVEAFLELHEERATNRYKYSEVKKMTNFFKDKLGEGGYGSVFKGQLPNGGAMVAVKILSETKGNGDDFINELASISKTFHRKLITYLGYCVDRGRRALIYEFMPNGSLEKYIYYKVSAKAQSRLGLMTLYNIAIGIADGLQYLHEGGVSRKADVYSYGKMLLEMAGGRKIFDVQTETYYPPWIYDKLVANENLELYGITTPEEELTALKMILVGLWCIQTDPAVRPYMSEVVQMLKGSLDTVPIPPRPSSI
ncbi:Pr5-like receptor kinase [Thalictrum thalictroides]|uniref:Pr5-like receptor kinase n=1 Tax=Thalictrum thalictroides TaxID=46969 RepID=A0A7J6X5A1_THATH|nr:Pr5-like receptor kinase [Thalictrum thalictroides]